MSQSIDRSTTSNDILEQLCVLQHVVSIGYFDPRPRRTTHAFVELFWPFLFPFTYLRELSASEAQIVLVQSASIRPGDLVVC